LTYEKVLSKIGWHYDHNREHEGLNDKTPAEACGIEMGVKKLMMVNSNTKRN
jgi:hypothetical protein